MAEEACSLFVVADEAVFTARDAHVGEAASRRRRDHAANAVTRTREEPL
jgi:hypothetical protein